MFKNGYKTSTPVRSPKTSFVREDLGSFESSTFEDEIEPEKEKPSSLRSSRSSSGSFCEIWIDWSVVKDMHDMNLGRFCTKFRMIKRSISHRIYYYLAPNVFLKIYKFQYFGLG